MNIPRWAAEATVYHIYPLGFLGAPHGNPGHGEPTHRLDRLRAWIPHLQAMGVTCVQLGPLFESSAHGYDTVDYYAIDRRLGDLDTFRRLLAAFHRAGIRVILDGVFNHSGRGFFAFQHVLNHGPDSPYASWYHIDEQGHSKRGDPFNYRSWQGHTRLPVFNHDDPAFREYMFGLMRFWLSGVGIDGWRLDVAHELPRDFLEDLCRVCREANPECFIVAEAVDGNYTRLVNASLADSATNYQTYSQIRNSLNAGDLRPLQSSLATTFDFRRGIYRGLHLMTFLGNHDVTRIASDLHDNRLVYPAQILLHTLPGIPTHYYGDEAGMRGHKNESDHALRQAMPGRSTGWPDTDRDLLAAIKRVAAVRAAHLPLFAYGDFSTLAASETVMAFLRRHEGRTAIVALNIGGRRQAVHLHLGPYGIADGTRFIDALNPDVEATVRKGGLSIDAVWPMWGSILVEG